MESESLEIECPVCDQKMPADAQRCSSCGVELMTAGMAELEEVARDISEGRPERARTIEVKAPYSDPAPRASEDPSPASMAGDAAGVSATDKDNGTKERGGLRRLFGRKKR